MAGTSTKLPGNRQEQDDQHNPSQQDYDAKFNDIVNANNLRDLEGGKGETSDEPSSKGEATTATDNQDDVRDKEKAAAGWSSSVTPSARNNNDPRYRREDMIAAIRKKGPLGLILAVFLGGGGIFSFLMAPGLGIVQFKEIMVQDLNDQLTATTLRSEALLRAKLKGLQPRASICTSAVKIRCQMTTMSSKQVAKFKDAGFEMETKTVRKFGIKRQQMVTMSYTLKEGPLAGTKMEIKDPHDLSRLTREHLEIRSATLTAYNPKFAGFSDFVAKKVFSKLRTDKTQKVRGNTEEERQQSIQDAVAGVDVDIADPPKVYQTEEVTETDEDGNETTRERRYIVEDGERVYQDEDADRFNRLEEERTRAYTSIAADAERSRTGGSAAKGVIGKIGRGLSITGAVDTACTLYNTARALAATAKILRAIQFAQLFVLIANVADRIKAGVAGPGEVATVGAALAAIDTNKTIMDEQSITGSNNGQITAKERPNPDYGKNAYDSEGYHASAYNDAEQLSARAALFTVGGGLTGTLTKVMDTIDEVVPGDRKDIRSACKVVQSWWMRTIGLLAGIVSAVGTFGVSTVVSASVSLAIGFALPYIQAALADTIAGKAVDKNTKGKDMGNGGFSGASVLMSKIGLARGMQPGHKKQLRDFQLAAQKVEDDYVAVETYEARKTPFDVMNQYSFLGSAVRTVNPILLKSTASVSAALINLPTLLTTAAASAIPNANAASGFNEKRYEQCTTDAGYNELHITPDLTCVPRLQMSKEALAMSTEAALNYMLKNEHINDEGEAKSEVYKKWLEQCTEREAGLGETTSDDAVSGEDIGENCVYIINEKGDIDPAKKDLIDHFGAYFMNFGQNKDMDGETQTNGTGTQQPTGKWQNPAGSEKYQISSPYGPRSSGFHDGIDMAYHGDFFSACDGTIKSIGNKGDVNTGVTGTTNIITIDCGGGITTKYMHYYVRELDDKTKVGATVTAGQRLGITGNQGNSFGIHLHYQIEQAGKTIDPQPFMKKQGVTL